MMMLNQGKILDVSYDEKRESFILNLDCAYLSSSFIDESKVKYSYISSIEIKDKYKDNNLTLEKLLKWKNEGTILGFFFSEEGKLICAYDGENIQPLSKQNTVPLSFFNKKYLKGYEHIIRWGKIGFFTSLFFVFMGIAMSKGSNLFSYQDLYLFIFKFTTCFSIIGFISIISSFFSLREIKKIIKKEYNPSLFENHEPANSIHDIFRRRFTFNRKNIDKNDVISAINESNLSATDKLLLQDVFDKNNKKLDIRDLERIKEEYFKHKM